MIPSRIRHRRAPAPLLRLGALSAIALWGCAPRPPALPGVRPADLPEAWLSELGAAPCPGGLEARLRMRVEVPGEPGVRIDGTLKARLPDSLRVTAKLGVFRPLFVLHARADSCGLLFHEEKAYWVTSRDEPDWRRMNPSAWARALGWALCPQSLARGLETDDPGRMEGRDWVVEGTMPGESGRMRMRVDPESRSVVGVELLDPELVARAELRGHRFLGEHWIATRVDLEVPRAEGRLRLQVELQGPGELGPGAVGDIPMLRPPGWAHVDPGGPAPSIQVDPSR
jgi:hypothetical protein